MSCNIVNYYGHEYSNSRLHLRSWMLVDLTDCSDVDGVCIIDYDLSQLIAKVEVF